MKSGLGGAAVVLMYHRVYVPDLDPWKLSVTPAHFAEHMELLRRAYTPLSLSQLSGAMASNCIPPNAVAVTFDDGYADVLHEAVPTLERHEIPATVFLVSGYVGRADKFWWDDLETLLLLPGTLPRILELGTGQGKCRWDLGSDAVYGEEAFKRNRSWRGWGQPDPSARQTVFREVWEVLQRMLSCPLNFVFQGSMVNIET